MTPRADETKGDATYRVLKAVVISLGVLIVIALGALVGAAIVKGTGGGPSSASAPFAAALPADARIVGTAMGEGRILVQVSSPAGDEVLVFDAASGRLLGRIAPAGK